MKLRKCTKTNKKLRGAVRKSTKYFSCTFNHASLHSLYHDIRLEEYQVINTYVL